MANFLKDLNLSCDPLNVFLVIDLFFLKDFNSDLYYNAL